MSTLLCAFSFVQLEHEGAAKVSAAALRKALREAEAARVMVCGRDAELASAE